jgi:superfamily II DNA or RNA helicase
MGTGKTLMSFTHAAQFGWNALYICPDAVMGHVLFQLHTHFRSNRLRINLQPRAHFARFHITMLDITTFTRLDPEDAIFRHKFNTLILDEIHTTCTKKKFVSLFNRLKACMAVGLTSTPSKFEPHKFHLFAETQFFEESQITLPPPKQITYKQELSQDGKRKYNDQLARDVDQHTFIKFQHLRKILSVERISSIVSMLCQLDPSSRVAIFSEFNETLLCLAMKLPRGSFIRVDSSTPKRGRFTQLRSFAMSSTRFLLCSRALVGIGHDLDFIDVLIICEPPFLKESDQQLIGRLTRLEKRQANTKDQVVIQFMYENTCEQDLTDLKTNVHDFLLDGIVTSR